MIVFLGQCVMRMAYIARPRLKNKLPKELTEAVVQTLSVKKVFLEISQNSQETPVPQYHRGLRPATLLK